MRVLAIEDDPELGRILVESLGDLGFAVDLAASLEDGGALLAACGYSIVLLDLSLPDGSGLRFLHGLREQGSEIPVIVLSAADSVGDRVAGFFEGADDYLGKPFAAEELAARMRAILRRAGRALSLSLRLGDVAFNSISRQVEVAGRSVALPRRELMALETLMRAEGRVVTHEALEEAIYALDDARESNVLESCISRLRRRLDAAGSTVAVRVMRGLGYRLEAAPKAGRA
jgi:DNA-binding response OmpR family regulator